MTDTVYRTTRLVARANPTGADPMTLAARVMPWNTPATVSDDGTRTYTETWQPGSLVPDPLVVVYDPHQPGRLATDGRRAIGRADSWDNRDDGLWSTFTLADTERGREVFELARTLGAVDVSVEVDVPTGAARGDVVRTADSPARLSGVAVMLPPAAGAFAGAVATAARAEAPDDPDPDETETDDEPDELDEPDTDPEPDPDDETDPETEDDMTDTATAPDTDTAGRGSIDEQVRTAIARYTTGTARRATPPHPFAGYTNFDELHAAARAAPGGSDSERFRTDFAVSYRTYRNMTAADRSPAARAWVDQLSAENPGIIPPAWLSQVFGIIDQARPAITGLGGPTSPGPSGMDVNWPYFNGDLRTIVLAQSAEKAEINSVKVSFLKGSAPLLTYAGGSDVSYQLQRRSSPGYMALYDRILQSAYGLRTEIVVELGLAAVNATANDTLDLATDTDGAATRAALFAASSRIAAATGKPATVALASSDVFLALGGSSWLMAPQYGTQNVAGTTSAATLRIEISGLPIYEAPDLPAGTLIVTNDEAAKWFEEGPYLATAEDVAKLGTDVAIWGMGAFGAVNPGGVQEIAVTVPIPAGATARKRAAS